MGALSKTFPLPRELVTDRNLVSATMNRAGLRCSGHQNVLLFSSVFPDSASTSPVEPSQAYRLHSRQSVDAGLLRRLMLNAVMRAQS